MHRSVNSVVGAKTNILTGRHALCLRVQSSKARDICQEQSDCSSDAGKTHLFGEEIHNVLVAGNKTDFQELLSNEVPDEMKPKVHVLGAEAVWLT